MITGYIHLAAAALLALSSAACSETGSSVAPTGSTESAGSPPAPCGWLPGGGNAGEPSGARMELCEWALGADAIAVVRVEGLRTYTDVTSLKNTAPGAGTALVDCTGGAVGPGWVLEVTPTDCLMGDCPVGKVDIHFGFGHEMSPSPAELPDGNLRWYNNQRKEDVLPVGSFVGVPMRREPATQLWSLYGMNLFGWDAEGTVWFDDFSPSAPPDVDSGTDLSALAVALKTCDAAATDAMRVAAREVRANATGNPYFTHAALCSFEGN